MKLTKADLKIAIKAAEQWPLKNLRNWTVDGGFYSLDKKESGRPGYG